MSYSKDSSFEYFQVHRSGSAICWVRLHQEEKIFEILIHSCSKVEGKYKSDVKRINSFAGFPFDQLMNRFLFNFDICQLSEGEFFIFIDGAYNLEYKVIGLRRKC